MMTDIKKLHIPRCSKETLDWDKGVQVKQFASPWTSSNSGLPETHFKALHDEKRLHIQFKAFAHQVHIHIESNEKLEVAKSDRIEIFFSNNLSLSPYYCLEIDPTGRVLDYQAFFHRKFNYSWVWDRKAIDVKSQINGDHYLVKCSISLAYLRRLNILNQNSFYIGLFRAHCLNKENDIQWISWVDPKTDLPDFHIPDCFGKGYLT